MFHETKENKQEMDTEMISKIKFSFSPKKIKRCDVFERGLDLQQKRQNTPIKNKIFCNFNGNDNSTMNSNGKHRIKDDNQKHLNINDYELNHESKKLCKEFYENGVNLAMKGEYSDALKALDMTVRFWGLFMDNLKRKYSIKHDLVDNSLCDKLMNEFITNKNKIYNKKKTKLWKPPPMNQPRISSTENSNDGDNDTILSSNNNDNDEVMYFSDNDDDMNEDIDIDIQNIIKNDEEKEIEINEHKIFGAKIYESMGQILIELNREFDAIKILKQSINLNINWEISWLTLSIAELNFGDTFRSLKTVEYIIENNVNECINKDSYNDIISHYSHVYNICNNILKLKDNGKINEQRIYSRIVTNKNDLHPLHLNDIKRIKKRLKNRKQKRDNIGKIKQNIDNINRNDNNIDEITHMAKQLIFKDENNIHD